MFANPSTAGTSGRYGPGGGGRAARRGGSPRAGAARYVRLRVAYLIDASNLGGALGGAQGARDPQGVVAFLAPWARDRGRVVVVFDGPEQPTIARRYGALEVRWSGARPADDRIVAILGREPGRWTVVTGDRELARRARDAGAKVEPASALAKRVAAPHPRAARGPRPATAPDKPPAHAEEREHWRRVFGDGEE